MTDVSRGTLMAGIGGLSAMGLVPALAEDGSERMGMTFGAPKPFGPEMVLARAPRTAAYLKRDRRWCQRNLQPVGLLLAPRPAPAVAPQSLAGGDGLSRLGLVAAAPHPLGVARAEQGGAGCLCPQSPFSNLAHPATADAGGIAGLVGLMPIAPNILGLVSHMRLHGLALARAPRFASLVLADVLFSAVLTPALMVDHVRAVLRTVGGLGSGWMPHVAGRSELRTLLRCHAVETGLSAVLLARAQAGKLSMWLLAVVISLCLTVPLAALIQMPRSAFHVRISWRRIP